MGQLKILAPGDNKRAQAQARGKLFEKVMADVLRKYGYEIDRIPNVNYAGMEIDIEGKAIATGIPLYAECKCYETELTAPKLQAFFGKYMGRWRKDNRSHGLFIAIPGVNSHARGFYNDNCQGNDITVRLLEEKHVLEAIYETQNVSRPEEISRIVQEQDVGTPGDIELLYTENGVFWVQYVIPKDEVISKRVVVFDAKGDPLDDKVTTDYLTPLYPELSDFDLISIRGRAIFPDANLQRDQGEEEIVKVRGSSATFEYQFPASPEHFVGRQDILTKLDRYVEAVLNRTTSSRGVLFEANSGWGKSSVVLASVDRLQQQGHFALAIDSRSASSSQFILRVVDFALHEFGDFNGIIPEDTGLGVTGFEGAAKTLLRIGAHLKEQQKVLFIFLDQFENVFFLEEALKRIRNLLLKLCDAQTNVVLGFAWKTDMVGFTNEFPYRLRDTITNSSERIPLDRFSEVETNALLDRLGKEIRAKLSKALRFFLSEFSQGYPWLLKKLCAHVKAQREAGVSQRDIASSLLNVEELFQEDLRGLSPHEEDALRRIAKVAPVSIQDLEEFRLEVIDSLVHHRLIVKIANKYDVYWDIFRDYLNTGRVPIQENYILRTQSGSVYKGLKLLFEAGQSLRTSEFRERAALSEKSFFNVARDMRLLGIANVVKGKITLQVDFPEDEYEFDEAFRTHIGEKLSGNRLVWQILERLKSEDNLTMEDVAESLVQSCPYISASQKTWLIYARTFSKWMEDADLTAYDYRRGVLSRLSKTTLREPRLFSSRRRRQGGLVGLPEIQHKPVETVLLLMVETVRNNRRFFALEGISESTYRKSLLTLRNLGFITLDGPNITLSSKALKFYDEPESRTEIISESLLAIEAFKEFIEILVVHKRKRLSRPELWALFREKRGAQWTDGTAEWIAGVMLNWVRRADLAPDSFANPQRKGRKPQKDERQIFMFPDS